MVFLRRGQRGSFSLPHSIVAPKNAHFGLFTVAWRMPPGAIWSPWLA